MAWIKFIHVLFGVTFFGGIIGSYFYTCSKSDQLMQDFIFKNTRKIELNLFVPMILVVFITGTLLVAHGNFTFTTPWIIGAYTFLTLVLSLLLISRQFKKNKNKGGWFHITNGLMIFLLAVIVHDAVMKHTILGYFFA